MAVLRCSFLGSVGRWRYCKESVQRFESRIIRQCPAFVQGPLPVFIARSREEVGRASQAASTSGISVKKRFASFPRRQARQDSRSVGVPPSGGFGVVAMPAKAGTPTKRFALPGFRTGCRLVSRLQAVLGWSWRRLKPVHQRLGSRCRDSALNAGWCPAFRRFWVGRKAG